ncbi:MAG: NAD-glutamate dehydrogenase [Spirochaetia bacterium]|nr:NAD-glutamate dehydrogenase [Spirochaetia bacterium]
MINSRIGKINRKKIIKEIINSKEFNYSIRKKKINNVKLEYFFEQYIKCIPNDYLKFLSISDLVHFVIRRYEFFISKNNYDVSNRSIKILVNEIPEEEWIINAHIIEILMDDMPFIKNSLIELFQHMGYSIRYLLSDCYSSNDIFTDDQTTESSDGELRKSFYALFILDRIEDFKPQKIQNKITELLKHVNFVTKDFNDIISVLNIEYKNKKIQQYFKWLCRNNFIFLSLSTGKKHYGLFNDSDYRKKIDEYSVPEWDDNVHVIKTDLISNINRSEKILIISFNNIVITGIFTRKADNTSTAAIPLLSDKLNSLIKSKRQMWTSLDIRDFTYAFDLLPLIHRFTLPVEDYVVFSEILFDARLTIESKIRVRSFKKGEYFLAIIWPINDLGEGFQQKIKKHIEKSNLIIRDEVSRVLSSVVYFFYELKSESVILHEKQFEQFEQNLLNDLLLWEKKFDAEAEKRFKFEKYISYKKLINSIIQTNYKEKHSPKEALMELDNIFTAFSRERLIKGELDLNNTKTFIKVFSKHDYNLSYFIPIFSTMDINVHEMETYQFNIDNEYLFLYKFNIKFQNNILDDIEVLNRICETIDSIMDQKASSEPLNSLILTAKLSIFQIELLKALVSYLVQIKKGYSRVLLKKVLQNNPGLSEIIVSIFEIKLINQLHHGKAADISLNEVIYRNIKDFPADISKINDFIKFREQNIQDFKIKNIVQAELYKMLTIIIQGIVRTNYFTNSETISFKVRCDKIDFLIQPSPLYEIWVYHAHFEGIHLRGGLISRGGIRWSERQDDFREEVWGLWKTQVLKNTIIVPTGAKGGFVLKYISNSTENAVAMYKKFIRSLIFLTDNRIHNKNIRNKNIPVFDEEDSYLVVAADKGTASFSDYANEIAIETDFWLGDAFASGGKNGYSHKALGITALGAWESARWHLRRLNKSPHQDEISVVGIGDMSGDVFGNAMIFSNKIKLIGAFNHKHIFIDPDPDLQLSFKERVRLFKENGDWSKYDADKISKGGGVFERDTISIKINQKLKTILDTTADQVSGEEMIKLLLKSSVDMIFNGGIGTYIKSSNETSMEINDLVNDNVRVDALEVRASMIIEGGNLGVSHQGRIEYSNHGGLINTDAIDNSGGVDLSDHEVNLKILFKIFMDHGLIKTLEERNKRLKKLALEEVELVLQNNFIQNWALVYLQNLPLNEMVYSLELIDMLKSENLWSNSIEKLRDLQIISDCIANRKSIPNPLLAILQSLSKIYFSKIFTVNITDYIYNDELDKYFPESLIKFKYLYLKHPLKIDIIKTKVVNRVIDLMGFPGLVKCLKYLDLQVSQVIHYYFTSRKILNIESLNITRYLPDLSLRKFPECSFDQMFEIKFRIEKAIYRYMEMVVLFKHDLAGELSDQILPVIEEKYLLDKKTGLNEHKLNKDESVEYIQLIHVEFRFAIEHLASKKIKPDYTAIFDLYYNHGIFQLKKELYRIKPENRWQIQSQLGLKKVFWSGLVNCNPKLLRELIDKINLNAEINKLKSENNINLSTLSGIVDYLFT